MSKLLPLIILITNPLPPGVSDKMHDILGWVRTVVGLLSGIAFVIIGAFFCFAYFSGSGSGRAIRALIGAMIGCVIIGAASAISGALGANLK